MTSPGKRFKKKKFVRITKGTSEVRKRDITRAPVCGLCAKVLQGTPKGSLHKLAKTEKRPSIIFGGVLCSNCRDNVFDEAILLKTKQIAENEVSLKTKHYVKEASLQIK